MICQKRCQNSVSGCGSLELCVFSLWAFSTCKLEIHYWKYLHLEIYGLFCFYLVPSSCNLDETTKHKHGSYGPIMEESTKIHMF